MVCMMRMNRGRVTGWLVYTVVIVAVYFLVDRIQHLNTKVVALPLVVETQTTRYETDNKDGNFPPLNGAKSPCKKGWFKVAGMVGCHKMLGCEDIRAMKRKKKLGGGIGKLVHSVEWEGIELAMVSTRDTRVKDQWILDRVRRGAENIINLQPSPYVIQTAGFCRQGNQTVLVTEKCGKYGNLASFVGGSYIEGMGGKERLKLAIGLVRTFVYLHVGSGRARINCDLHHLEQALSQYLITDDMRVVLNDVDELPTEDLNNPPKCSSETKCIMMEESFLAPEQRYTRAACTRGRMPGVTTKVDVWKIPNLTNSILTARMNSTVAGEVRRINRLLKDTHDRCKRVNPLNRCTSQEVLKSYIRVYNSV